MSAVFADIMQVRSQTAITQPQSMEIVILAAFVEGMRARSQTAIMQPQSMDVATLAALVEEMLKLMVPLVLS